MEHIVQLKNDASSSLELNECVNAYFEKQNRSCKFLPPKISSEGEWYALRFLIDRKHVIEYSIPIDRRNYFATLLVGVGPCFVFPIDLMNEEQAKDFNFSMDSTTEAVEHNLVLLDKYFETQK
jgi:hypothetical protein